MYEFAEVSTFLATSIPGFALDSAEGSRLGIVAVEAQLRLVIRPCDMVRFTHYEQIVLPELISWPD